MTLNMAGLAMLTNGQILHMEKQTILIIILS